MARETAVGTGQSGVARPTRRGRPPKVLPAGYHHGDLRNALLVATDTLLAEAGLEKFTLREVARRAGVSHGAPAHHFGDVRGLLSAYTAEGFAELARAMARRRAAASPAPFAQLLAVGLAYVDHALAHRARFQLMFRSDCLDPGSVPLAGARADAYAHLVDCIARIDRGADPEADLRRRRKTALAWSMVHGFATLTLDNAHFAAEAGGDRARALAMVEALLRSAEAAFRARPRPPRRASAPGQ
jgi:AcrR family transcriptional regulator